MGGGHLTRPNYGSSRPNPNDPMTEFYLLLERGVEKCGQFAMPGCWGSFKPDFSRPLFEEDMPALCRFSPAPGQGNEIFGPRRVAVNSHELWVTAQGSPIALIINGPQRREHYAVQLLPPFPGVEVPPPPAGLPRMALTLNEEMIFLADARPDALAERLALELWGKAWEEHPEMEKWMTRALALAQREYRKMKLYT